MDDVRTVVAADTVFLLRAGGGGDGVPVLLLHGVPETSSCWADVAPALARDRRVLAPDLPGLGGSTFTGPYDVTALVAQLAALLDGEGVARLDVVGHDWGGVLALALAGLRPDLVRRLVVVNAPYGGGPPVHRAVHVPLFALPVLPEAAFRVGGRRLVGAMLAAGWRTDRVLPPERRAEYEAAYTGADRVRGMLGYYRAAVRPRAGALRPGSALAQQLPPVNVEQAHVLWGAADPVLPVDTGEDVVRRLGPGTRLTTLPGVGHFAPEEAPEQVADVLLDVLS